jgi:Ser/Thr protein kinase RdoA (MazF antagonist)
MSGCPHKFDSAKLFAVAEQFASRGRIAEVRPYGYGNVHDTFLVSLDDSEERPFLLQRVNTRVFPRPELVLSNLRLCTGHVAQRLGRTPISPPRRWEVPRLRSARDGRDYWADQEGSFWRALSFIAAAQSFEVLETPDQAQEVGYALGLFHRLLSDLDPARLADTLPGFHVTPEYLRRYDEVLAQRRVSPSPEAAYCLKFIEARRAGAAVLEEARAEGKLRLRPIHGDPKVNNVLLDSTTGQAVALVDLDTVKPGLTHYDIGDCLRSGANPRGEETEDWEAVQFDPDLGRALLTGYLPQARDFLFEPDYAHIYEAIRLIAFELGLRFFTDYLAGNVYFKARHREHNLARALVQFKLTASIESQEAAIRALIRDLR